MSPVWARLCSVPLGSGCWGCFQEWWYHCHLEEEQSIIWFWAQRIIKKKSVEQKANMGGGDTLLPSFIEKSKIKEWLLSQGGSVQMWPPSFVDFLWTRESFIGYSPTFLFTLRPTFWLGWEQLSVFLFAAHQSKTLLMLEAWLQPT